MTKYQPIADLIKDIGIRLKLDTVAKMNKVFPKDIIASYGRGEVIYHNRVHVSDEYVNSAIAIDVGKNTYRIIAAPGCWEDHLPDLIKYMEDNRGKLFTDEEIARAKSIIL